MTQPSYVDALRLTNYQRCVRRWRLEQDYRVVRWQPKQLFDACLRRGIVGLSAGQDPAAVASEAKASLLAAAADPGLDVLNRDPYRLAVDYCAMLDTILESLSRLTLLTVRPLAPVAIAPAVAWRPLALADESGSLHRWITVDSWDEDRLSAELHSWFVAGDLAVCQVPLTLHVVVIGQIRDGKRYSPWARAYKHPVIAGRLLFRREGNRKIADGWKPVWYSDFAKPDPKTWVDLLDSQAVTPTLIHHIDVAELDEAARADCIREILLEHQAQQAPQNVPWRALPMSRGACDAIAAPCPWQGACYGPRDATPDSTGLYQLRPAAAGAPAPPNASRQPTPVG